MRALAELYAHATRGDTKAAEFLVKQWLGEPERSVRVRSETMTLEEVDRALAEEGCEAEELDE